MLTFDKDQYKVMQGWPQEQSKKALINKKNNNIPEMPRSIGEPENTVTVKTGTKLDINTYKYNWKTYKWSWIHAMVLKDINLEYLYRTQVHNVGSRVALPRTQEIL